MRLATLVLLTAIAVVGNAWAAPMYTWTGAVDNNWATPGNWTCSDPNAPAGPPVAVNSWEGQYTYDRTGTPGTFGDDVTIATGNVVIGAGVTATGDYNNLAVAAGSGPVTVTIDDGGTFFPAIMRAGQYGSSLNVIQNGGLVRTVWVWNQPRSTTSTTPSVYTMNAGTGLFGEFNLNTATTNLYIAPGAVFKELGSTNYWDYDESPSYQRTLAQRIQKWTDYILAGKVTTAPGYTLSIVTLPGEGYSEGGFTIDALQIVPVPEPATLALLVLGGLAALRRRR